MTTVFGILTTIVCLVFILDLGDCRSLVKRQADLKPIDPHVLQELTKNSIVRDKRKVDVVTGVKNAVLGFVFNKLNSFIDQKTAWIDQLDKQNIAKNAAANIVPPADPITSLSAVISGAIGEKLQAAAPLLNIVTSKLGSISGGGGGGGHSGFDLGALVSKGFGSSSGASSGGGQHAGVGSGGTASKGFAWEVPKSTSTKRPTTTEDAVQFKPGEPVSLEIPDKLFGSSFTLVTNLSTRVGDYVMSSAVRAQRLLESMRPFLRAIFGAGGIVIEATTDRPIFSDPNSV
ncbi:unnamed protein product [Phyllotreta striolata]|uniref:Uncharacterized protein n=1 Tax=Phyllotreta striolata TaxID=444603 RepID=A0A9N9TR08_PHYSR|nr:unnamed protein product [Phyllotreta striolata]